MTKTEYGEDELVGNDLSGVVFVRDYLQLQFDPPPTINALSTTTVIVGEAIFKQGEKEFANALIGQIGKVVAKVLVHQKSYFAIIFSDQSIIKISLEKSDRTGPEAVIISLNNNGCVVL